MIAYTLSSTNLEIRAKYFLLGNEGVGGKGGVRRGWGKGEEMTQTLYAHMNKLKIKKIPQKKARVNIRRNHSKVF
jgi:hypothetical protein